MQLKTLDEKKWVDDQSKSANAILCGIQNQLFAYQRIKKLINEILEEQNWEKDENDGSPNTFCRDMFKEHWEEALETYFNDITEGIGVDCSILETDGIKGW